MKPAILRTAMWCGALIFSSFASAATQTVSHTVNVPETGFFITFQPGSFPYEQQLTPITGLPQFDPALGTLTDFIVEYQWDFSAFFGIQAEGIFDGGVPHSATGTLDFWAVGIAFERSDGGMGGALYIENGSGVGCFGEPGDGDGCSEATGFSDSAFTNPTSLFDFTDVVGTGSLDIFSVEIAFSDPSFELDNVGTAYFDAEVFVDGGSVTITYVYDDGVGDPDTDGDGVSDPLDSCIEVANADQIDSDADGYGDACDVDVNNDCIVNISDLGLLRAGFFGTDPVLDFNNDGIVNVVDLGLMRTAFFGVPGPSGLTNACDP